MNVHPARLRGRVVLRRNGVPREPPEDVTETRLTRLVSEPAGHDAVLDDTAHAFDLDQLAADEEKPLLVPMIATKACPAL